VIAAAIPDAILLPTDECSRACIRRPNMSQICSMGFNGRPSDVQQLMFTLRIWVFKSGDLKKLFVLSKHGTKANIRSTKMVNNRHAYNRDVLQSYLLFEYGTGCEWHRSNQMLQCPVVTIRCYPWSAGSWQVFHIVGL
jgi:hypothetical protein